MKAKAYPTLRELGISIEVFSGDDRNLVEAQDWSAIPAMHRDEEGTVFDHAIAIAKATAESEADAAAAEVSICIDGEWQVIWQASYIHTESRWPWQ